MLHAEREIAMIELEPVADADTDELSDEALDREESPTWGGTYFTGRGRPSPSIHR